MDKKLYSDEIELKAKSGMGMLLLSIFLVLVAIAAFIVGVILLDGHYFVLGGIILGASILYMLVCWIPFLGLKILKPQEALVLTLFGKYIGTLKGEGFYYVNPFVSAVNPAAGKGMSTGTEDQNPISTISTGSGNINLNLTDVFSKKISLKAMTLNNNKQKVNEIGRAHV